jgi:hypothetical protein
MSDERWIEVVHWHRFQHYSDRDPPWIKNYLALLHDENYLSLTGHQRAVLHGLWLEYASARCQLPLSTRSLTRRLALRVSSATLEALNHAGFIRVVASKPLALARSREAETEAEKSKARQSIALDTLGKELEQWTRHGPTPTPKR